MKRKTTGVLIWCATVLVVALFLLRNWYPFVPFRGYETAKWLLGAFLAIGILTALEIRRIRLPKQYRLPAREITLLGSVLFAWLGYGAIIGLLGVVNHFTLQESTLSACVQVVGNDSVPNGLWERARKITVAIPGFDSPRTIRYRKSVIELAGLKKADHVSLNLSKGFLAYEVKDVSEMRCPN